MNNINSKIKFRKVSKLSKASPPPPPSPRSAVYYLGRVSFSRFNVSGLRWLKSHGVRNESPNNTRANLPIVGDSSADTPHLSYERAVKSVGCSQWLCFLRMASQQLFPSPRRS